MRRRRWRQPRRSRSRLDQSSSSYHEFTPREVLMWQRRIRNLYSLSVGSRVHVDHSAQQKSFAGSLVVMQRLHTDPGRLGDRANLQRIIIIAHGELELEASVRQ